MKPKRTDHNTADATTREEWGAKHVGSLGAFRPSAAVVTMAKEKYMAAHPSGTPWDELENETRADWIRHVFTALQKHNAKSS